MSRAGILEPGGLLGKELRDRLDARPDLATEVRLLTQREEEVGTLTEVGGSAAMVQAFGPDDLDTLDLLFVVEPRAEELAVLERVPPGLAVVVLAPTTTVPHGHPVIADHGVVIDRGEILVSPHPVVVGLAHLLRALAPLGLEEAVATSILPASIYDQDALEEVFEQTRALLEFKRPPAGSRFRQQIAFNLLPAPIEETVLLEQLRDLVPGTPRLAVHAVQAGVFHGLSLSVFCQLGPDVGSDDIVAALSGHEQVELAESPETVGPVAAATGETIQVGEVKSAGRPGAFWLWAALDNLTRGGATNAIEIASRLAARG